MSTPQAYDCEHVIERINDFLDRELSAEEMALVQAHLDTCEHCASAYAFESRVLDELKGKLRRIDLPQSVLDKVRKTLSDSQG
jgi:anti-sigma factor (TIGR02949 family)